ncbi:redoxin domain-containing protein [Spongiimicrobium salis]|uniref:redoxin domain-containing protein n=1 Tax=Spongiimicrobium salis TaxID=1667022 RepID=UPI00374CF2AF
MIRKLLLGILLTGFVACKNEQPSIFSLTGKTKGITDGTVLYLNDPDINADVDSTVVTHNSFVFNTTLDQEPLRFYLHDKDYSNYTAFWAENTAMQFDASTSDFRNAKITGSETEALSSSLMKAMDTVSRSEGRRLEKKFVKDNPNSIISANMLNIYATTWGKQLTQELFNNFSEENKNSKYGKEIATYIALNKNPKIGEHYIDFEMLDPHGVQQRLSDSGDKIVLLEFWASWCGPCRQENPNLVKTYETYKEKGFEVFAVSLDNTKESWLQAIEKDKLGWRHVSDLKGSRNAAGLIYGVSGIPDNFLIDKNGSIIARNLRGEKLNEKLSELLK